MRELNQETSSEEETEEGGISSSYSSSSAGGAAGSGGGGASEQESAVYLKFCRIGEVALELTTVGFGKKMGVQLDRQRLPLNSPSFHRSERVVTWKQLGQKYVKHIISNLITSRQPQIIRQQTTQQARDEAAPSPALPPRVPPSLPERMMEDRTGKNADGDTKGSDLHSTKSRTPPSSSSSSSSFRASGASAPSPTAAAAAAVKSAKGVRGAATSILNQLTSRKDKEKPGTPQAPVRNQREALLFGAKR
jgi:hypothetical protein